MTDFPFGIEDVVQLVGLNIRRFCTDGVYTDCPICGDCRGKLKVNYEKNVWRCNYCNASGGMLQLYASVFRTDTFEAYNAIYESIRGRSSVMPKAQFSEIQECERASSDVLNTTYSALLRELTLSVEHREHLRNVRGLSDGDIDRLGFKSTPPYYLCRQITDRLMALGYTVEGVPGFYLKDGKWTVNFCSYTSGILLPAKDFDGRIVGVQIRLDSPFKDESGKIGAKYIWLSSSGKAGGASSGSPIHLIGDRNAKTVYVTEGILKADVSHALTGRTFAAIAGANNLGSLDGLMKRLASNGTRQIIEAHDMDKYRNRMVDRGASEIAHMAGRYGMECKRLTWNPNYKGIDDWQLALRRKNMRKDENRMNFTERFVHGLCDNVAAWDESSEHSSEQGFRIYQLNFDSEHRTYGFAFEGIDALHDAGYDEPPASDYRLVYDNKMTCTENESVGDRLDFIFNRYNDELPSDYSGRSISPSDVVELYDDGDERRYFYRDRDSFCEVKFSPMMAKPMK